VTTFRVQPPGRERKSLAGRKPIDVVLMFKIVFLHGLYNLSDDQTEFQIRDRASFQRFLGLHVEDGSPRIPKRFGLSKSGSRKSN
jgi:hypothetical protein